MFKYFEVLKMSLGFYEAWDLADGTAAASSAAPCKPLLNAKEEAEPTEPNYKVKKKVKKTVKKAKPASTCELTVGTRASDTEPSEDEGEKRKALRKRRYMMAWQQVKQEESENDATTGVTELVEVPDEPETQTLDETYLDKALRQALLEHHMSAEALQKPDSPCHNQASVAPPPGSTPKKASGLCPPPEPKVPPKAPPPEPKVPPKAPPPAPIAPMASAPEIAQPINTTGTTRLPPKCPAWPKPATPPPPPKDPPRNPPERVTGPAGKEHEGRFYVTCIYYFLAKHSNDVVSGFSFLIFWMKLEKKCLG